MDVEHPTKLTERCLHVPLERERCEIPAHGTLAQIEAEIEGDSVAATHSVDAGIEPSGELFKRLNLPGLDGPAGAHRVPDDKGLVLRQ